MTDLYFPCRLGSSVVYKIKASSFSCNHCISSHSPSNLYQDRNFYMIVITYSAYAELSIMFKEYINIVFEHIAV